MVDFAYNNAKSVNIGHTPFELNCKYYFSMFYDENINPRFKSKLIDKLLIKLQKLMTVYYKNFYYTQKL